MVSLELASCIAPEIGLGLARVRKRESSDARGRKLLAEPQLPQISIECCANWQSEKAFPLPNVGLTVAQLAVRKSVPLAECGPHLTVARGCAALLALPSLSWYCSCMTYSRSFLRGPILYFKGYYHCLAPSLYKIFTHNPPSLYKIFTHWYNAR